MPVPASTDSHAARQGQSDERELEDGTGVYMACVFQAGKLGIASYDTSTAEVRMSNIAHLTARDRGEVRVAFQLLSLAKLHLSPQVHPSLCRL